MKITLKKKNKNNGQLFVDHAEITDGISITKFQSKVEAQKIYMGLKQKGTDASLYRGVLIQRYKDKKAKEIAEMTIEQIEALKKSMRKKIEITYDVEEREI